MWTSTRTMTIDIHIFSPYDDLQDVTCPVGKDVSSEEIVFITTPSLGTRCISTFPVRKIHHSFTIRTEFFSRTW